MSQNHEKTEKMQFKERLSFIIQKYKNVMLGFLILLIVVIIGLIIFSSLQMKNLEKNVQKIEAIQEKYQNLSTITDENEKKTTEGEVLSELKEIIDANTKDYSQQRALFMRGNIYFGNEEWDNAIADFSALAEKFPNSYLAPVSLINAAVALEETDQLETAISKYLEVIDNYSDMSPEIANIYFSIGRLYEALTDNSSAVDTYNTLIDKFPNSNWTNLARSRIIYLESR